MATLKEVTEYLDGLMAAPKIVDYCPNGLQVQGRSDIRNVAVSVSASLKSIRKAVELKADILLVHHGLFWNKDPYVITGTKREKLKLLIENDISLIAYHLPLDAHETLGNNWKAAKELGWKNLQTFAEIGVSGAFPKISIKEFQKKLETYYKHPAVTALGGKDTVSSAALISGGAYRYAAQAAEQGIDCFITGNFDEPVWHQAFEEHINFFALGHAATEEVGVKALAEKLSKHFKLKWSFIDDHNPF